MKRTKKKNVMVRAMLAAFVLIFSLAFAGTAMAGEYVSGTAPDVQDPNADRLFTVSGSWTKYEPCAELNIPMERLQSSIIAAKKTGHDPMIIWTPEKLNAEEEAIVLNSLKGNPGVGNPKDICFVCGNEYTGYGMTISLEDESISFERPSSWALIFGGLYEKVYISNPIFPENPTTDTDPGDVPTDTDTGEVQATSTNTDSGDCPTDTNILDSESSSTDTIPEKIVPGPEVSEPETPPTDTDLNGKSTGTDINPGNDPTNTDADKVPTDTNIGKNPIVPSKPDKPSVSGDTSGSPVIEEHHVSTPVIKNDSAVNDIEAFMPHKVEADAEDVRVPDEQPKTGVLPEYYVWLVLSLISALVTVFKTLHSTKHTHMSTGVRKY